MPEYHAPSYADANVGGVTLSLPAATAPDEDTFRDSTGTDTGITGPAYAVNEHASGSIEIPHDYVAGTDLSFHVHWQGIAAPTGTDYVKWQAIYTIADHGVVLAAATTIVVETAFDTRYEFLRSDFPAISGAGLRLGMQFLFDIKRIAAVGDAYAGDALVATVGIHYRTRWVNHLGPWR